RERILLPRRCSFLMPVPRPADAVHDRGGIQACHPAPGLRFRRSTHFSICGALESHTFHLLWGECTITLQNVAYHLGLRIDGDPVGGSMQEFQLHYQ
ncbi:hypothetical protein PIB30_082720, partial [Stylosanthes scabra]|nr:hypothetical protein [Stylosanthes scabra]